MDIERKKVLVTGGAKRIGREICKTFAASGAKVLIHYNSSESEAVSLLKELGGKVNGHAIIKADLNVEKELSSVLQVLEEVDILINNASIFNNNCLSEETIDAAKKQFDINFWAPFTLMKELHHRRSQRETIIINMLDFRVNKFSRTDGSYALSKRLLTDITTMAALQWAPEFRVNGIAPGFVIPPTGMESSRMEKSLKNVPLHKAVSLNDICAACVYLVKTESITGEIIHLDGGAHL